VVQVEWDANAVAEEGDPGQDVVITEDRARGQEGEKAREGRVVQVELGAVGKVAAEAQFARMARPLS